MPDIPLVASHLRRQKEAEAEALRQVTAATKEAIAAERERQREVARTADAYDRMANRMRSLASGAEGSLRRTDRLRDEATRPDSPLTDRARASTLPGIHGPYQQAERLREELARADSRGIGVAGQGDIRIALAAAEARIKKFEDSQKKPSSGGISGFISSFRGGGNPYIDAARFVYDAEKRVAEELIQVAESAADAGRRFSQIRTITGAGAEDAARLRAYGIDPSSTRSLQDRITSDSVSMMFAQRVGVTAVGGPFGTLDTARTTLDLVRGLRTLEGEEQLRAIRALGIEHLAPLLRVSQRTLNRLEKDAEVSTRFYDRSLEMRTAEYDIAKERFGRSGEDISAVIGQRPMEFMTRYLNFNTEFNKILAEELKNLQDTEDRILKFLEPIIYPFGNPFESLGAGSDPGDEVSRNTQALDASTQAISRLTRAIGGGERAGNALPSGVNGPRGRGDALVRAYETGALRLGVL